MKKFVRILCVSSLMIFFLIMILLPLVQLAVALDLFLVRTMVLWYSNAIGLLMYGSFGLSLIKVMPSQNGSDVFLHGLIFFVGIFFGVSIFGIVGLYPPVLAIVALWMNVLIAIAFSVAGYCSLVRLWKLDLLLHNKK